MAATEWAMFGHALEKVADGTIDLDSDAFRMVLVGAGWTPNQANDDAWSDISANEVPDGNGYSTHGKLITQTLSRAGLVLTVDCNNQSWPSSTLPGVKYAVIVRDGDGNGALAAADIPMFWCELEDGSTVSTTNGTLAVNIHANGVYQFTLAAAA